MWLLLFELQPSQKTTWFDIYLLWLCLMTISFDTAHYWLDMFNMESYKLLDPF